VAAAADSKSGEHGLDEEAARQLALRQLVGNESPIGSLAVLSLAVMPTLVFVNQRVGKEMGSRALVADSKKTWVCS
jgi:divalent metal cation (Fe/Co/Zn/Cd) transporter